MIGIIGKNNDKGLGTLTRQYEKFLNIDKSFYIKDPRTPQGVKSYEVKDITDHELKELDVLIILEMPLVDIFRRCRLLGVKTILKVNYEFLPEVLSHEPDLYLCSSSLNYESVKGKNKILISDPVDLDEITTKKRKVCKTFVHNAGTLGIGQANGTDTLLEALKLAREPFKMIIRSQVPIHVNDPRVELRIGSIPFEELYLEGDVFVLPQKFRATSLPIQEAMASGMPVLCSDIKPFNEFVNFTFPVHQYKIEILSRRVNYAILDPRKLAKSLDTLYNKEIEEESEKAIKWGKENSWQELKEKYKEIICNI